MSEGNESVDMNAAGHLGGMERGDELSCSGGVNLVLNLTHARLVANAVCVEVAWPCQFWDDTE